MQQRESTKSNFIVAQKRPEEREQTFFLKQIHTHTHTHIYISVSYTHLDVYKRQAEIPV